MLIRFVIEAAAICLLGGLIDWLLPFRYLRAAEIAQQLSPSVVGVALPSRL
jgi:hypothetical protein